jgi:hypothetical protein
LADFTYINIQGRKDFLYVPFVCVYLILYAVTKKPSAGVSPKSNQDAGISGKDSHSFLEDSKKSEDVYRSLVFKCENSDDIHVHWSLIHCTIL